VQRINFKLLLVLLVGIGMAGGGLYALRKLQISRNAEGKFELAKQRLAEGKGAEAMDLLGQYVSLRPDDHEAFAEYSKLLLARATAPGAKRSDIDRAFGALETAVRRNPDDDDLRLEVASFQVRVGRASDALDHLNVLEERIGKPAAGTDERSEKAQRVQLLKASSYLSSSDFEQAAVIVANLIGYDLSERRFTEAGDTSTAPSDAYVMLAAILQERMSSPDDAREVLEKLVEKEADDPRAWLALATWHRGRGRLDDASEAVEKARALAPDDADFLFAEFELALARRDMTLARATAERAVDKFPGDERATRALASVAIQAGELPRAEEVLLSGLEKNPSRASLLLMLADVLLQQDKLTEASQAIARTRELYGATSPAVGLLEARLLLAERRWTEAKAKLEQVRPMALGNTEVIRQVDLYLTKCHAQLAEYDSQLEVSRRILTDDPTSVAARAAAAEALMSSGRTEEALAEFEALSSGLPIERLVEVPQIWYPLIQLRIGAQGALPRAKQDWSIVDSLLTALEESGRYPPSQLGLLRAEALMRRGEQRAARDLLTKAATPDAEPTVWAALVTLELRADGPDAAIATLARVPEAVRGTAPMLLVETQVAGRQPRPQTRTMLAAIEKKAAGLAPPDKGKITEALAAMHLAAGERTEAERLWQSACELQPSDARPREALLELAIANGDLEKARAAATAIAAIAGPTSARTRVAEASVKVFEARQIIAKAAKAGDQKPGDLPADASKILDAARGLLIEAEAERPGWVHIQLLSAEIENLRGEQSAAIDRLKRAVTAGATNPQVIRRLVAMLYAANRLDEAQRVIAMLGDEGATGLERISAEAELRAGKLDEAVALAEQSVAGDTQNHADLLWLGQLLARSGRMDRAGDVLERAAKVAPEEPEVWLALFSYRLGTSDPAGAEKAITKAASLMPEPRRQMALAQAYEMLGRTADAERLLQEAVKGWPDDLDALRNLAAFEARRGRAQEARTLLEKILAMDGKDVAASKAWARRVLTELTATRGTFKDLEKALGMLRENRSADGKAAPEDLDLEITLLANRPEPAAWRRAITLLDELVAVKPMSPAQRFLRAQLLEKVGRWDEARSELMTLVAPRTTPAGQVAMLVEKLIDHGELSNARTWLRRLAQMAPNTAVTLALEAKLALAESDRPRAVEFARQLMPGGVVPLDNPAQLAAVGKLMEDLGFMKAADKVYEQYAALGGDGVLARIEFLSRQGRTDEAMELLETHQEAMSLERALTVALRIASAQTDDAKAKQAAIKVREKLEKAKRVDSGSLVLRLIDAELVSIEGREADAEKVYRDLLASKDLDATQRAIVANNLAFHLAAPATVDEARQLVDVAIEQLGAIPDLLDTRGLVRLAGGDARGAVEDLREAVLVPSAAKYLHLAVAELAAGDDSAARSAFKKSRDAGIDRERLSRSDRERLRQLEDVLGTARGAAAPPSDE
jgi:tetratricopeptide (TPR) repeat protein